MRAFPLSPSSSPRHNLSPTPPPTPTHNMAAAAQTSVATDEGAVRDLLRSLFFSDSTPPAAAAAAAASEHSLSLHPCVEATHPLGTAHSAEELAAALRLYSNAAASMSLEIDEVLLGPDKALATGHLVVLSHLSSLASCAASPAASATAAVPLPHGLKTLLTDTVLPTGLSAARVPITVQMRLGRNDAGDAVVTHTSLVFSLLSALLPHVELNAWQQEKLQQSTPALLGLLQQLGSAATVAEDTITSVGAAWSAGSAVVQATVGQVLSAASHQVQSMWASRMQGGGGGGGGRQQDE